MPSSANPGSSQSKLVRTSIQAPPIPEAAAVLRVGHELTNRAVEHQRRFMKKLLDDRDLPSARATFADDHTYVLHDQNGLVIRKGQGTVWFEAAMKEPESMNWAVVGLAVR